MVYFPSGIKEVAELAEQNPNHNAIRGDIKDRKKDKLALNIPYKRCTFTPKRKFTLGNYYSFSFERNQKTKEIYLLAKLFKSSKLDKKKNIFPFSIETTKIRDYKIRVGIKVCSLKIKFQTYSHCYSLLPNPTTATCKKPNEISYFTIATRMIDHSSRHNRNPHNIYQRS